MSRYWLPFAFVTLASFALLIWVGTRIYQEAPPIPDRVVAMDGTVIVGPGEISEGQNVWQSIGGMEVGSIWGHGSYVAPDWTADWLHREALFVLDAWAHQAFGADYADLDAEGQALLKTHLEETMRRNTYDPTTRTLLVPVVRARAFDANLEHYADVFENGDRDFAMPAHSLPDATKMHALASFFFWTSWAASTDRPGETTTYTSNWPHEPLVGNDPTSDTIVWTGVSIIALLAGIGGMAWWRAARQHETFVATHPASDPLLGHAATPSQRATLKYFWVAGLLLLVQIAMGVLTAHYGVEGGGLYGIPIAHVLPYSVTRTWHTQLGIFWIATTWLATGLYIAPAVGGHEPRGQRAGVNVLFVALLVVVVGSMTGEWVSVVRGMSGATWFWLGHSGYEYIDLGRLWQLALLVGLVLWLGLVARGIVPALRRKDAQRPLLVLFLVSAVAIAGFYGAALGYGRHTNLAVAEYWRWWVVHLWVEGFFEVFATVVIAFLFTRLSLVGARMAAQASVLSATIFLAGGIVGTLHHLYFAGTPTFVLALGSVFSALEVVPLVFLGYEAWENIRLTRAQAWVATYRWAIYFFVAVAFWNTVGAGLFGFMINPPIALYYMQGLNTTPVHGHTALFGVYGMLGMGLVLFCGRLLRPTAPRDERLLGFSFWAMNVGLLLMVVLSVLPVGLYQTWASVKIGYWFARSPEFLQLPFINRLRWLRVIGDTIFAFGAFAFVVHVFRLGLRPRPVRAPTEEPIDIGIGPEPTAAEQ